jgi:hypothetical protein
MIRSRGSAARSATVRIGVGFSCQLVLVLVLPPPGARWLLGLATSRLYSPISFSRSERNSSSAEPPP